MELTKEDVLNIIAVIKRANFRGDEILGVANLQVKLQQMLASYEDRPKQTDSKAETTEAVQD